MQAYDAGSKAGTGFDALLSYDAHKAGWPNAAIALGVEVCWADGADACASHRLCRGPVILSLV